jgi:integrase
MVKLKTEGYAPSYMFALHSRLAQIYSDAIQDGIVARSPLSRRTSPGMGKQRPYVATTEQVWALHEALQPRYRAGLLLAAYAGLRLAEVCGLKVADIDFMRGVVSPVRQYPDDWLKTECSQWPIPIPASLALTLSAHVKQFSTDWLMTDEFGHQMGPWQLQRAFRAARSTVQGLPDGFRFHDLRHHYASLLISSGLDVKVVQTRLRHASAKTTLDTYTHLWPDSDDSTRAAIDNAITARSDSADFLRTREEVDAYRT